MSDTDQTRKTLRVREVAEMLGVSVLLIYRSVERGEIPAIKLGKTVLIPVGAVENLIAGATELDKKPEVEESHHAQR